MARADPALPAVVLERWRQHSATGAATWIVPDGCRDLIRRRDADGRSRWLVSALATGAYAVHSAAGTVFDEAGLLDRAGRLPRGAREEAAALVLVDDALRLDRRVAEALLALAKLPTVAAATRALGVTERSLQRLCRGATGQPPGYWRALAWVRRAAAALDGPLGLADLAHAHGYADQAHFSRDCMRWLGLPPARLRAQPALLALVRASGHGS